MTTQYGSVYPPQAPVSTGVFDARATLVTIQVVGDATVSVVSGCGQASEKSPTSLDLVTPVNL